MARCSSCRAVVTDEAAFCPRCGNSMTGGAASQSQSQQVAGGEPSPPAAPTAPTATAPGGYPPAQQVRYGAAPTDGNATGALVCSILSFVVCPVVLAIVGLVLASSAKKKIAASGGAIGGEGLANAATVISIINLALSALIFFGVIAISFLGKSASSKFSIVGSSVGSFIKPLFL
jgi:uncharacterized protein DUF4190